MISGEDVCCSVTFGTLVGVFGFSVILSELLMSSAISCTVCICFRGGLGFLNCNDICMSVVNKQKFELLKFVFDSVYVDLQYDEIYLIFTAGYVCLCGVCSRPWYVCEVVLIY